MTLGRVSVIVAARNEPFLQATVDDLLAKAYGDLEVIVILDGYWPDPPLAPDDRVRVIHNDEPEGMRPAINAAAQAASGQFLMKCDAHCIFAPGFDETLKFDCADDWLVVPTRHSIDIEAWTVKKRWWNYHFLSFAYGSSMYGTGLHGMTLPWKDNLTLNDEKAHLPIDDQMTFQGSCWFQHTANFLRLGPLDHANYYFYQEAQEVGLRQWMTGGRCVVNKKTWYAHMHKTRDMGRGFYLSLRRKRASEAYAVDFWLNDRYPGATRTFASLIEQFWPLPAIVGWPEDWQDPKHREAFANRPQDPRLKR